MKRIVNQVTKASAKVYIHKKREGFIRDPAKNGRLMSRDESYQDLMNTVG